MDAHEARDDLEQARRSYIASVQPVLPRWAPPVCGLLTAAGITLAGLAPASAQWRLVSIAIAVLLAVSARLLVLRIRARQGVRGIRGPARKTWTTLGLCAVAFLISANHAAPSTRGLYAAMGVGVGIFVWIVLRKKVRP
ncbi:hypothetical protein [Streptomyces sp. NPDC057623]|uniref:hypothetical protein n=1 Tax=Streptomyces sp. NPDC057623 TaxID=3346187 RepID=UPI0036765B75